MISEEEYADNVRQIETYLKKVQKNPFSAFLGIQYADIDKAGVLTEEERAALYTAVCQNEGIPALRGNMNRWFNALESRRHVQELGKLMQSI